MIALDSLFAAKANRDVIRAALIRELNTLVDLPADVRALLKADRAATTELSEALAGFVSDGVITNGSATIEL